ncbi:hypothetical protein M1506_00715 [Patescibacteria group bacterium]|nr:hypothetical protein [Patescibacteria group bacterium]
MQSPTSAAFVHILKVAAYIVGSAVIPAIVSLYTQNATFMAFAPILNLIAVYLQKYSEVKAAMRHQ